MAIVILAGLAFLIHGLVFGPRWWRNELPGLAYRPDDVPEWWPYGGALWRGMLRTPLVGWIAIPLGCAGAGLVELDGVFAAVGEVLALVSVGLVLPDGADRAVQPSEVPGNPLATRSAGGDRRVARS